MRQFTSTNRQGSIIGLYRIQGPDTLGGSWLFLKSDKKKEWKKDMLKEAEKGSKGKFKMFWFKKCNYEYKYHKNSKSNGSKNEYEHNWTYCQVRDVTLYDETVGETK